MDWIIIFVVIIGCVIGAIGGNIIAHLLVSRGIGIVTTTRFFNRVHRYIYVPLFRRKWSSFDEYWYNKWEPKAKKES